MDIARYRVVGLLGLLSALLVVVSACEAAAERPPAPSTFPSSSAGSTSATAPSGTAAAALAELPVKGRAPMTGYTRAQFGRAWTDTSGAPWSHDDLSTRDDVLSRDLTSIGCKYPSPARAAGRCVVRSGVLHDPYTGATIDFTRGEGTSLAVQIDHVVALGDAWQTGAQQLSADQRVDLANDPLELLAVDGPTNEAKGDGDAATWLPPDKGFRCAYVARQVAVKVRYRLWVTAAERAAIARVLARFPGQPLPDETTAERSAS